MKDFGYDISDFRDIDPIFGTMADFNSLLESAHSKGLKLVMDFVPNHSSDEHEWFLRSLQREDPYTDYYVWQDPAGFDGNGNPIPPNNWVPCLIHWIPMFLQYLWYFIYGVGECIQIFNVGMAGGEAAILSSSIRSRTTWSQLPESECAHWNERCDPLLAWERCRWIPSRCCELKFC